MGSISKRWLTVVVSILALGAMLAASARAIEEVPGLYLRVHEDGKAGSSGGRLNAPAGIDVDPSSGHFFVAEEENARISEFTAWGEFVKAWGWGVVASGPGNDPQNEIQKLTVDATGGSYSLTYTDTLSGGIPLPEDTAPIPYNASPEAVKSALEALPSFAPGDLAVSGVVANMTIEFIGSFADVDILPLRVVKQHTLTGGTATVTVETIQGGANFEICVPSNGDVCRKGQGNAFGKGGGFEAGQLNNPTGIAVDSSGSIYVLEARREDRVFFEGSFERHEDEQGVRVQKFDPEGNFLLMFGGNVNKTTGAEVCTKGDLEGGDECGIGEPGTEPGQFSIPSSRIGDPIDIGPGDKVFVGDKDRIQKFGSGGAYESELAISGETVRNVVLDSAGNYYLGYAGKENARKLSPAGTQLITYEPIEGGDGITGAGPAGLALDSEGNLYAIDDPSGFVPGTDPRILVFDPAGEPIIGPGDKFDEESGRDARVVNGIATSSSCNVPGDTIYVSHASFDPSEGKSYVNAYGETPDPAVCPAPPRPPHIAEQYAVSAGSDSAVLRAEINPRFWTTTHYVQYGTQACPESGWTGPACSERPVPPATLGGKLVNFPLTSDGVVLTGLAPETTYHYRFVAQSGGGGPVFGEGGGTEEEVAGEIVFKEIGEESTFTTFPLPLSPKADCPNQAFRIDASSRLPDCRAYEMVSPVDKNGGDASLFNELERSKQLNQSSTDGERFTYSSYAAFADPEGVPNMSQYLATREDGGWSSTAISPPRGVRLIGVLETFASEYRAFSPDLCSGWLRHDTDRVLDPGTIPGYSNILRRDLGGCGEEGFEAVTKLEPPVPSPNTTPVNFIPELQGVSADGRCAVFRANGKLTNNASSKQVTGAGIYQVYESCEGKLRPVSILPEGKGASDLESSVGTLAAGVRDGRLNAVWQAVSPDGSRIYWSAIESGILGKIYVRDNADQAQSPVVAGACTEPATKACTFKVSETASVGNARFWGASKDGSKAIFEIGDELHEFDFDGKSSSPIADGVKGVLGASEDLSRVYFVSTEDLDLGGLGTTGEFNLYLGEGGDFDFIATLATADVASIGINPVDEQPASHAARVSPDGMHAAFMATSEELSLAAADYDNLDANSGQPSAQVYLYDAAAQELRCISCIATGARPSGREIHEPSVGIPNGLWAAAELPTWETQLYAEHALSDDGSRLFFESYVPLVLRDTNGRKDVYEWELADSKADCAALGAELFSVKAGGCLSLISSGRSPEDSEFLDATPDGSDAFFATASSLLPQDYGLIDIYDARVGGGFPIPESDAECEGEACRNPPPPPDDPTPASSAPYRNGNVPPPKPKARRCGKGKKLVRRNGKARCVKKQSKRRSSTQRRAAR